MITGDNIYIAV